MANGKIKFTVEWSNKGDVNDLELQNKTFNDVDKAITWVRTNYKHIFMIGDKMTFFEPISHFDIMDQIKP